MLEIFNYVQYIYVFFNNWSWAAYWPELLLIISNCVLFTKPHCGQCFYEKFQTLKILRLIFGKIKILKYVFVRLKILQLSEDVRPHPFVLVLFPWDYQVKRINTSRRIFCFHIQHVGEVKGPCEVQFHSVDFRPVGFLPRTGNPYNK
jgi:hypothetical protein